MSRVSLRYLDVGTISIERDGTLEPVRGRRVSSVLAALLMRANQPVSSDALIEVVWSGSRPPRAEATLDSHLWRLRQALEPDRRRGEPFSTVVHDGVGYRLAVTAEQVDSLLFEKLAGEARDLLVADRPERALSRCDEALTMWRGEPWAPHSDEPWAADSTSRLHQLRAQLRRQRVDSLLRLGNPELALNDIEPMLVATPLDESLWAMAMLAAYRLGRVGQALETYTRARRALIDDAGVEPGQQLRDLQAKILHRDKVLAVADQSAIQRSAHRPEIHLPVRRTELIGRESEVGMLVAAVTTEQLVTVVGPAGCGKTRLAIEVAREAAPSFDDGVWFVDLTSANDSGQLLDVIASALGLAAPEVGTTTDALRAFARSRRMLLVLDNCEHLLDAVAELVDVVLGQRSDLALLATSREPLAVEGEEAHTLAPFPVPSRDSDTRTVLAQAPAVRLFLQSLHVAAPQHQAGLRETEPDDEVANQIRVAARICEAVDGLPLAIELAAGQARSYTLDEILTRVRTDSASLARTGRGGARHHATLSGAIKLSVDTLTPEELTLHQAIAVVPGPLTTGLAAHLADNSSGSTAGALARLSYRSMLSSTPPLRPGGPSRFSQLVTIRSQSLSVLPADAKRRLEQRRDAWVADLMSGMPTIGHASELDWFTQIDDNLAAVRATLHHCLVERPVKVGAFIAPRLNSYWFYRGMVVEWERWTGFAARSPAAKPFDRLIAGCCHAGAASVAGRGDLSRRWMDELEDYPHTLAASEKVWLVYNMLNVALACYVTGAVEQSRRVSRLMRDLADETNHPGADLFAEAGHVLSASQTESSSTVLPAVEVVYQRAQAAENHFAAWSTATAGVISAAAGHLPDVGLRWSDEMLGVFGRIGVEPSATILELRGLLLAAADQPYEAIRTIARSRSLARRTGTTWPALRETTQVLSATQSRLPPADAERAYQQGLLGGGQPGVPAKAAQTAT